MLFSTPLPIDDVLADVAACLAAPAGVGVLVAPPGAGKTTRVPLALMDAAWLNGKKILVLEPRRIAARGAAERMASTLGSRLGETVGLRARFGSKVGPATRVEIITEGVFTRMILDDPELGGVGAVVFDEFHERSLDADLGLALALDCRASLRPDLRILVMSATLDGTRVAKLLGHAPVIESKGRAFPVETRYFGRKAQRIEDDMCEAILHALRAEAGSILAFLPGQREILRVAERLAERVDGRAIDLAPLYGAMDGAAQDLAIEPAADGRRKIVLATSIAETSITIAGVRIVIDSGQARVPYYEADVGVTRLETVRVSRAAADQRRGRAGRTEAGICFRLWDEPETQGLVPFAEPEIKHADLAGLLLDCAEWGVTDPGKLSWLDPPSEGLIAATRGDLVSIGALDASGRITPEGRRIRALPLAPRLARMVLSAAKRGAAKRAAEIAAVVVERGIGGTDADLDQRLRTFRHDRSRRADDMRRLAQSWAALAETGVVGMADDGTSSAGLLALAYPDRIAKARGAPGHFLLANGRAAHIDTGHPLAREPYVVVGELQGRAAATRILLAAALAERELLELEGKRIVETEDLAFDPEAGAVRGRRRKKLDAITLASEAVAVRPTSEVAGILADGLARSGIQALPWSKAQQQLRARVGFLRSTGGDWPDLTDAALAATVRDWLQPFLVGKVRLGDIATDDLAAALATLIPWPMAQRINAQAPTHFEAPTGTSHLLDYEGAGAPALHIRVQELFGLKTHPAIACGKLPLTLYLLSPAHRPIQITRDLPGFWAGSWAAVKADMRGQYPKHPWPDDPANALPTTRVKRRSPG